MSPMTEEKQTTDDNEQTIESEFNKTFVNFPSSSRLDYTPW